MSNITRILSIDGGGIRGIIPATVLAELEKRTGQAIHELFDLVAGTSTGGIVALGLTLRRDVDDPDSTRPLLSAEDLVDLYTERGSDIFQRSGWRAVSGMGNLTDEKYDHGGLEEVMRDVLGQRRLSDAMCDLIIPSYALGRRRPFFFKSRKAQQEDTRDTHDFPAWEVARAASAAPTYFEPHNVESARESDFFSLIDGGVFANNPSMCALAEALNRDNTAKTVRLVSLGTGKLSHLIPHEAARSWGIIGWAKPLLDVTFDGVSDTVDYQVRQILRPEDGERHYWRLQTQLPQGCDSLDNTSQQNIRKLGLRGKALVDDHDAEIDAICEMLTQPASAPQN
jgi:patatin-like phospholipase/acyl hydrolase